MGTCRRRSRRQSPRPAPPTPRPPRPGAYDGTWNVMFAPRAGNCSASNSVPFAVSGTARFVGRRRQGHRRRQPRRRRRRQDLRRRRMGRAAAAGSPAIRAPAAGAGSLPATAAAASGSTGAAATLGEGSGAVPGRRRERDMPPASRCIRVAAAQALKWLLPSRMPQRSRWPVLPMRGACATGGHGRHRRRQLTGVSAMPCAPARSLPRRRRPVRYRSGLRAWNAEGRSRTRRCHRARRQWSEVANSRDPQWMQNAVIREWQAMAAAIADDTDVPVSGDYGRHIIACIDAAMTSAREGRDVKVTA